LRKFFELTKSRTPRFTSGAKSFVGMDVPDAKKLRELEIENAKMKRLIADLSLDVMVLKDALGKK
jgi:putative transposase